MGCPDGYSQSALGLASRTSMEGVDGGLLETTDAQVRKLMEE